MLCLCVLCCRSLHSQQADGTGTEPGEQVTAYQQPGLDYSLQRRDTTPVYPHMITSTQHIQSEYGKCDNASCLAGVERDVFWGASVQETVSAMPIGVMMACRGDVQLTLGSELEERLLLLCQSCREEKAYEEIYIGPSCAWIWNIWDRNQHLSLESPALLCIFLQLMCVHTNRIKTLWKKL